MGDPIISTTVLAVTGAAAAASAAMANAVKASGAIIRLDPEEFAKILSRTIEPVIVISTSGFKKKKNAVPSLLEGFRLPLHLN